MPDSPNHSTKLAGLIKRSASDKSFPEELDYFDRFRRIDDYLNENVHPYVNQGAAAIEPIWLTDHGSGHITTVMQRASDLTFIPESVLSPYEAYVLLLAIHFHDVGNVYGRQEHERRITEEIAKIDKSLIGNNSLEQRIIRDVAMAHGGVQNRSKDTIGQLRYESPTPVRVQQLAAILRFADELSDDHTRTSRFLLDNKLIAPESEVYHRFCERLRGVRVDARENVISLRFELNENVAKLKCQKHTDFVYLFDEILTRLTKMHLEHIYCSRFMTPFIHINRIEVSILLCTENYMTVLETIQFVMAPRGYPEAPPKLSDLCPELAGLTGYKLKSRFKQLRDAHGAS